METDTIGTPLVEAMHALNRAAQACDPDEDRRTLNWISSSANLNLAALKSAVSPPSEADIYSDSDRLAFELYREADATYACIQTLAAEAERRWRDSIVFDDDGVGRVQ